MTAEILGFADTSGASNIKNMVGQEMIK